MQTIAQRERNDTVCCCTTSVLTYAIRYPFFTTTCCKAAALSINAFYSNASQKAEEYCRTVLASQAAVQAQYAKKDNVPFFSYDFISAYTITWNTDCMASLITDQYVYTGGANGNTLRTSDTWNFCSGARLTLADFYPRNPAYQERILNNLEQQIKKQMEYSTSTYFENYASLLRSAFRPENFYVTPQGLVLYFQQNDISPHSFGIPEFLLPF